MALVKKKYDAWGTAGVILGISALLFGIAGYGANLVKLIGAAGFGVEEAVRVVGLVAVPIGVFMGWFV